FKGDAAMRRLARVRQEAVALALAEMVGGFGAVLDMTVAYMKERVQFGQPLGKFQGVQFKCADLATSYSATKHTAFQAIWRLGAGLDASRELAIARAWCGSAYKQATLEAHQLHGGAGYVVEHPLHRYAERAQSYAILFAAEDEALDEVAAQLLS
ncbi:MAG: acyl-CoA dehydrogenase family protein, partial [Candidatus Binatia bacterium]